MDHISCQLLIVSACYSIPGVTSPPDEILRYYEHESGPCIEALKQITLRLADLKRFRNMAAFVNRLPTELLVEIFLNLVNLPWPRRRHTANLVTATHVCSHWRRVAVGAARLWTAVPLHNRVAADTFFKRLSSKPRTWLIIQPSSREHPCRMDASSPAVSYEWSTMRTTEVEYTHRNSDRIDFTDQRYT